jgi:hypothetical protein
MDEEPKEGANKGNAGKGRPAGSLNKTTRAAKEAIAFAAEGLGGAERMIEWAQEDPKNEAVFWGSIYPKLIPVQIGGEAGNPVGISLIERVIVKATDPDA